MVLGGGPLVINRAMVNNLSQNATRRELPFRVTSFGGELDIATLH